MAYFALDADSIVQAAKKMSRANNLAIIFLVSRIDTMNGACTFRQMITAGAGRPAHAHATPNLTEQLSCFAYGKRPKR